MHDATSVMMIDALYWLVLLFLAAVIWRSVAGQWRIVLTWLALWPLLFAAKFYGVVQFGLARMSETGAMGLLALSLGGAMALTVQSGRLSAALFGLLSVL